MQILSDGLIPEWIFIGRIPPTNYHHQFVVIGLNHIRDFIPTNLLDDCRHIDI